MASLANPWLAWEYLRGSTNSVPLGTHRSSRTITKARAVRLRGLRSASIACRLESSIPLVLTLTRGRWAAG